MSRRRIIRSLVFSVVVSLLMVWVASYWVTAIAVHYVPMGMGGRGQNGFIAIRSGQMSFVSRGPLLSTDWSAGLTSNAFTDWWVPEFLEDYYTSSRYHFLGFYFFNGRSLFVSIPLWFPMMLAGLLFRWVWRRTGGNAAGGAFPVESVRMG